MNASTLLQTRDWPYLSTLLRLGLAVALGLLVGLERERRGKDAGARTFALAAAIGCAGGLMGDLYAAVALGLLMPFVILVNLDLLKRESRIEITTSAAFVAIGFVGVLCGKDHTFAAVALGLTTLGLLAWKQPLEGFSLGITEAELRSAILLGIFAFVIYPALPIGSIDRWDLIQPRVVWTTVILVAAIGFGNYVLHKLYGSRGFEAAGFFSGLVNSIIAIIELATRVCKDAALVDVAYKGIMLATAAMLVRNAFLLWFIAPEALYYAGIPMLFMLAACAGFAFARRGSAVEGAEPANVPVELPFSIIHALKFGGIFLVVSVLSALAQSAFGSTGFYVINTTGAIVSSASSVASAGQLASHGQLSMQAGGIGAVLACVMSTVISIPIVAKMGKNSELTRSVTIGIGVVSLIGVGGAMLAPFFGMGLMQLASGRP